MHLAHLGLAACFIGVALTEGYSIQKDLRMAPGDMAEVAGYEFRFDGVTRRQGPNYVSDFGKVTASKNGRQIAVMNPEKRLYTVQQMPMTEAGIDAGVTRDLYVALGEPLGWQLGGASVCEAICPLDLVWFHPDVSGWPAGCL